jgi:hypothetical protein
MDGDPFAKTHVPGDTVLATAKSFKTTASFRPNSPNSPGRRKFDEKLPEPPFCVNRNEVKMSPQGLPMAIPRIIYFPINVSLREQAWRLRPNVSQDFLQRIL